MPKKVDAQPSNDENQDSLLTKIFKSIQREAGAITNTEITKRLGNAFKQLEEENQQENPVKKVKGKGRIGKTGPKNPASHESDGK